MTNQYQHMFEMQHYKSMHAASRIRDALDELNKALSQAHEAGSIVEILDHKGRFRPVDVVRIRIGAPLVTPE